MLKYSTLILLVLLSPISYSSSCPFVITEIKKINEMNLSTPVAGRLIKRFFANEEKSIPSRLIEETKKRGIGF
jgi:hypothetical protein